MTVRVGNRAQNDLDCIVDFISGQHGQAAADQFLNRTQNAIKLLSRQPFVGPHARWSKRHKELRFWTIGKTRFIIYYRVDQSGVSIERVLDGRRDVTRIIERGVEDPPEAEK